MTFLETFSLALKNIAASKLRSFLTMLGIIIGVCAVIVIVGLGNGMAGYMEDSFAQLGVNSLTVTILGRGTSRSVSEEQMYQIVADNDCLDLLSPTVSLSGSVKIGSETYSSTSVTGVSEDYLAMKDYEIAQGRGLQYMDLADRKKVCVVGSYVSQAYFGGNAVGQDLKVGSLKLRVVGVVAQQSEDLEEGGTDDFLLLPSSTAARQSYTGSIGSYLVTVPDQEYAALGKETLETALYDIFSDSNAYNVLSMSEMLDTMTSMINLVIGVLAVIAGISLVVGGIGIMNIMLVSVTERTREIGIRKALGAREGVILRQFVIEAAVTSALGGILGILSGALLSAAATKVIQQMMDTSLTVSPSASAILVAFSISAGIGVLFGYLPARKAARLDPIDALRYD